MATTRRDALKGLLALAASSAGSGVAMAGAGAGADAVVPPGGIGHGIRHLSYSDQNGRPDGV